LDLLKAGTKGGNRNDDSKEDIKSRRGTKSHFYIAQTKSKRTSNGEMKRHSMGPIEQAET
jgi:hypothetical protein